MRVKLPLLTFYLNGRLHAVSVGKPSERMSNFWTVRFSKTESEQNFHLRTSLLKRWVLSCFLKELRMRLGVARSAAGSWFQVWGPVNEKALSPNLVRSLGSTVDVVAHSSRTESLMQRWLSPAAVNIVKVSIWLLPECAVYISTDSLNVRPIW